MLALYILLGILGGIIVSVLLVYIISALLVSPKKEFETESPFYRMLLNGVAIFLVKMSRSHVTVHGAEKLPQDRKFLLVSNHRSNFDPIVSVYAFPEYHLAYLSKGENFKIPVIGRLIRKCCFLAIDREDPRKALPTIQKAARIAEKGVNTVAVYPEGTRSKKCKLLPFHNGVFKIAQKAHMPVAVMTLEGTEKIHKNFPLHKTQITLRVLEVIPYEEIDKKRTNEIGDRVRDAISQALQADQETAAQD
ncbi:MAG: 1-acyl-sn-glycerol-3-phosphate acyltransferase [Ruminococcaceae bacterium]|nr:1-acyl-sn-glycerol-3-phosphate acyltransferase [Oscillospiraceae bacterium]